MYFDELDLSDDILDALDEMQFSTCTPIQEQSIPHVLQGRDLIAVAQTGTGKTAAYLLPVIDRLYKLPEPEEAVNCIVMAPTRELAQQIDRQMEGFAYYLPITSVAIYGGTDGRTFGEQERALKKGADVVIATPGRLLAHMQMGYVDLSKVRYFILDEADRMLDMGFYDDIMQIASKLPNDRQTLMFSATMPPRIQQLAQAILNNPAEVKIAVSRPTEKIDQSAYVVYDPQKTGLLAHLLRNVASTRVIVFTSSKLNAKDVTRSLKKEGFKAADIHSDLDQSQRDQVMLDFRAGRIDVLVATDILARGIDIDDISMVVNYDVPHESEDYVHRIGRTARAGAGGKAVTFISVREQSKFGTIEKFLGYEVKKAEVPENLGDTPDYAPNRRRGASLNHGKPKRNNSKPKGFKAKAGVNPSSKPSNGQAAPRRDKKGYSSPSANNRNSSPANGKEKTLTSGNGNGKRHRNFRNKRRQSAAGNAE